MRTLAMTPTAECTSVIDTPPHGSTLPPPPRPTNAPTHRPTEGRRGPRTNVLLALALLLAAAGLAHAAPDPVFTLISSTNLWDGRSVMTVKTNISNWATLLAAGATNFTYKWSVAGVAASKTITPGLLTLTRAQGSGPMTVTLVMDNGGAPVTNSVVVQVQEPTNEAWAVRTPDATEQPTNGQFYARDNTGYGTLYYNGTIGGSPSSVFITIYTNNGVSDVVYTNISKAGGGAYAFTAKIKAGLVQYKLQFRSVVGAATNLLNTVNDLVCGDAYVVDGQSNAVTSDIQPGERWSNKWVRTYGRSGTGWRYACRGSGANYDYNYFPEQIGYWEFEIASNLVAHCQVPICMINGAIGGTRIDMHMPGVVNPINGTAIFDVLSNRVALAKLTHGIRAFLWHQGENDSGADGPDGTNNYLFYQQYFVDMSAAWKQACPNLRNYFIYQVYPAPCGMGPYGDQLREVQRTLPNLYSPRMRVMSTVGLPGYNGCHYLTNGYANMAYVMLPLVEQDIYGVGPTATNTAPNLVKAYYTTTNRNQITLDFRQNMLWNSSATNMFYLDNVGGKVTSGSVTGNMMYLQLSGYTTYGTITYLDDQIWVQTQTNKLLYGGNGISALTFADVPLGMCPTAPFVNITNVTGFIVTTNTTQYIAGTNNMYVVGGLTWTNSLGGGGTLTTGGWNVVASLYSGNNVIYVRGTNAAGDIAEDTVTVNRAVPPFVDITTNNFTVAMNVSSTVIGGTNNMGPIGFMRLMSVAGGATNFAVSLPAVSPWSVAVSNLVPGVTNFVSMTVTNGVDATSNDTVQIYRRPLAVIDITNVPSYLVTSNTTQYIAGTNNVYIVGGLTWTNAIGGGGTLLPGGWNFSAGLLPGDNLITVSGTNAAGEAASDFVTVCRTIDPTVDITNANFTVGMGVDQAMIGGTNNAGVAGFMRLTSVANAATNHTASIPAATSWTVIVTNLAAGATNFVTMNATNALGDTASDTVQIYRRPLARVDITNVTGYIITTNITQYIAGTNSVQIVGGLVWSNAMGGGAKVPANSSTGWSFSVTLSNGVNTITVWGTNIAGDAASDSVIVQPIGLSLIGHWISGATNLADTSGFMPAGTHDGMAVGANAALMAWSSDVPAGFTGQSLDLSANSVGVLITNTALTDGNYQPTFDASISNMFTIAFWFKGALPASPAGVWVSKCGITPYAWQMRGQPPYAEFTMRGAGMYEIPGGNPNLDSAVTVTNETWYHFAAVFNGTASFRQVYMDGVLQRQATGVPYAVNSALMSHLMLGANQANATNGLIANFWPAKLYDVRIYNIPFSSNMVSTLMAPPPSPPSVDITNTDFAVAAAVTNTMIGGTSANVAGSLRLTTMTGTTTNYTAAIPAATPWTIMVSNLVDGATNFVTMTATNTAGASATDSIQIYRAYQSKPSDVQTLDVGRGADYGQMQLSWSNGPITVLACTNRTYSTNAADWFLLATGVATPWTHTAASNFPSVYYRIVSGAYTSQYAVGKYDLNIAPGSIAWLSFPFGVQTGCDALSEWFGRQLEARPNSGYNYPSLQKQNGPGGTIQPSDYYINGVVTNWNPDNAVAANAGYILFLPQDHPAVKVTGIGMVQTNNVTMQIPYNSVPWVSLAYDVVMDMRASGITNLFTPPQFYSSFNYDYVDSQSTLGGPVCYAEYYRDNWGTGATNFFPSVTGADKLEPGKGYLIFFSTARSGTGLWNCVRPY